MLVLSRKTGESIMIGDEIEIIVTRIESDTMRIAISAPREVAIYRREIYDEIRRQKEPEEKRGHPDFTEQSIPRKTRMAE